MVTLCHVKGNQIGQLTIRVEEGYPWKGILWDLRNGERGRVHYLVYSSSVTHKVRVMPPTPQGVKSHRCIFVELYTFINR